MVLIISNTVVLFVYMFVCVVTSILDIIQYFLYLLFIYFHYYLSLLFSLVNLTNLLQLLMFPINSWSYFFVYQHFMHTFSFKLFNAIIFLYIKPNLFSSVSLIFYLFMVLFLCTPTLYIHFQTNFYIIHYFISVFIL